MKKDEFCSNITRIGTLPEETIIYTAEMKGVKTFLKAIFKRKSSSLNKTKKKTPIII